jgi:dienelactone hydrolase
MTFRRALRLLGMLLTAAAGIVTLIVAYFTRRMVAPARQTLWATPAEMGLAYENVQFPAQDSVRLSGWFIPAATGAERDGATLILVHDWTWNRLGDAAADLLADLSGATPVELLRLAHALHHEGYHLLMFDLRNHGESAAQPPVTFGQAEANDLLGALAYIQARPEVSPERVGVIGFSMGANAVLYALPRTDQIGAAIAVQPTTVATYAEGFAADLLGGWGRVVLPLVESSYSAFSGIHLAALQPSFAAAGGGATPVLFVQCKADRWGSIADADQLRAATPGGEGPLYVDGDHRYRGFQYLIENPRIAVAFFEQHIG